MTTFSPGGGGRSPHIYRTRTCSRVSFLPAHELHRSSSFLWNNVLPIPAPSPQRTQGMQMRRRTPESTARTGRAVSCATVRGLPRSRVSHPSLGRGGGSVAQRADPGLFKHRPPGGGHLTCVLGWSLVVALDCFRHQRPNRHCQNGEVTPCAAEEALVTINVRLEL